MIEKQNDTKSALKKAFPVGASATISNMENDYVENNDDYTTKSNVKEHRKNGTNISIILSEKERIPMTTVTFRCPIALEDMLIRVANKAGGKNNKTKIIMDILEQALPELERSIDAKASKK